VIEEIARVEKACKALKKNDLATFGKLMFQTHDGLQNEYEVSCTELDFLVEAARKFNAERQQPTSDIPNQTYTEGVLGARMMGGGFGGCTINLVRTDAIEAFIADMKSAYKSAFDIDLPCHVVTPKNGVEVILKEN
jgi:galactokinase